METPTFVIMECSYIAVALVVLLGLIISNVIDLKKAGK